MILFTLFYQPISHAVHMKSLICYKFADATNVYALQIEIYYGMPSRCCFVFFIFYCCLMMNGVHPIFFDLISHHLLFFFRLIHNSHWILICFKRQKDLSGLLLLYFSLFFLPSILQTVKRMNRK